jgi:hypothetical protein
MRAVSLDHRSYLGRRPGAAHEAVSSRSYFQSRNSILGLGGLVILRRRREAVTTQRVAATVRRREPAAPAAQQPSDEEPAAMTNEPRRDQVVRREALRCPVTPRYPWLPITNCTKNVALKPMNTSQNASLRPRCTSAGHLEYQWNSPPKSAITVPEHHVVEVRHDEVRVVQVHVDGHGAQEHAGQPADVNRKMNASA